MKKNKKVLYFTLVGLDLAITIFLLVLSIVLIVSSSKIKAQGVTPQQWYSTHPVGFLGFFQLHPLVYGLTCVVPLFVILAANIVGLVIYVRKVTTSEAKAEPVKVNQLSDEQKEALRREILADLQKQAQNPNQNEEKTEKAEENPAENEVEK